MQFLYSASLIAAFIFSALPHPAIAAPESSPKAKTPAEKSCTLHSPLTGSYFDLNRISLSVPELKDGKKVHEKDRTESWHAKGYDYGANFTLNFCAPVIENLKDVVGVEESRWRNVSAYYEQGGKIYSIGQEASEPLFRGRKLVLNYTDGSPCPSPSRSSSHLFSRKLIGDDGDKSGKATDSVRRKNTLISFLCDRDPLAADAAVSFVGSPDSCSYFFEVRSSAACGGIAPDSQGGLGPGGVFGVIALIAIAVYLIGGCAYQRTVMHQRGWRQCPNYSLWAGILGFLGDFFIITISTISHALPLHLITGRSRNASDSSGARYTRVGRDGSESAGVFGGSIGRERNGENGGFGNGRGRTNDDENRLIDQLDEEWDD